MPLKVNNRWQAFGVHLLLSVILFIVLASIIYFLWYPGILFRYDGGLEGMKLIAGVDFFIGPLLTLLVFRIDKPSLRFDLGCIAALQAACLAGGMWTVWQTRPVAVVYANHSFRSINSAVYSDYGVVVSDVPLLQERRPVWVWSIERSSNQDIFGGRPQNIEAHFTVDNYLQLVDAIPMLLAAGIPANNIVIPSLRTEAQAIAAHNANVLFYRASFGAGSGYLAFDTTAREAIEFLPLISRETSMLGYLSKSKVFVMDVINALFQRH